MSSAGFEVNEFWDDLLAFMEEGRVIPVVGAELLNVDDEGREIGLYQAVAQRLLGRYGLVGVDEGAPAGGEDDKAIVLRKHRELNDAVSALAGPGRRRAQDLYRPINDTLRALLTRQTHVPPALVKLAQIRAFRLFASTTPDDLLARALDEVRFGGTPQTHQVEYAPGLSSDRVRDMPASPSSNYTAVLYLLGKASASPFYAIHEEDTLEFMHGLQAAGGTAPERILAEMRAAHLLLIGCNFDDWLGRFFLRLSNSSRLSALDRIKREFLVDELATTDRGVTLFLERFSQNTRVYPSSAAGFVDELHRRWIQLHPQQEEGPAPAGASPQANPRGTVFISYASEDVGPARRLFAALKEISGDVAWFDKAELTPGDDWGQRIKGAIHGCGLFLPLISATTERRTEGYFRLEWRLAVERAEMIQGRKFIVPVVIDPGYEGAMSRYQLVPDRFRDFQYSHAPDGALTDSLRTALKEQLRVLRRPGP
jgi:hypothetical protein